MKPLRLLLAAAIVATAGCGLLPSDRGAIAPRAFPGARIGGTLTVATTPIAGVDPALAADPATDAVVGTLCDTLLALKPQTNTVEPALVESVLPSQGGQVLNLRLRHGVHFNDGTVLNAQDVAYSLTRLASPVSASPSGSQLAPIAGYSSVANDLTATPRRLTLLSGVHVIDQYDLQLALDRKDPDFLRVLTTPATAPISQRAFERDPVGFAADPVCVGPYRLAAPYTAGAAQLRMVRTRGYYAGDTADTRGGAGYADTIDLHVYRSATDAYRAFRAGQVDIGPLPASQLAGAAKLSGAALATAPTPEEEFVGLPDNAAPFSLPAVRRALSLALNRSSLIAQVWHGDRTPATGFLPPAFGSVYTAGGCGARTPATGDVAAARALLAAAHVDLSKTSTTLYVNNDLQAVPEAQAIARQWQAAFGMHLKVQPMPWSSYLSTATTGIGLGGPFRLSWSAPDGSAQDFLGGLFQSASTDQANWAHFASGPFEAFFTDVAVPAADATVPATVVSGQRRAYRTLENMLCAQMPIIPVSFGEAHELVRVSAIGSGLPGYLDEDGNPLLREMYLK